MPVFLWALRLYTDDDNARYRGNSTYSGSRDSGFRCQGPSERHQYVQTPAGRSAPPRGRQPSCGRRRGYDFASNPGCRNLVQGCGSGLIFHGPRTRPLSACGGHRGSFPCLHTRQAHHGSEPLHRPHRDRQRPHRMFRPLPSICIGRQHPGHSVFGHEIPYLRGDPGCRCR